MNWDKNNYSAQYSRTKSIKQLSNIRSSYTRLPYKKPATKLTPNKSIAQKSKSRSTIIVKVKLNPEYPTQPSSQLASKYATNCSNSDKYKQASNSTAYSSSVQPSKVLNDIYERMNNVLEGYRKKQLNWMQQKMQYENKIKRLEKRVKQYQTISHSSLSKSKSKL